MTRPSDRVATGCARFVFFLWLVATILGTLALLGGLLWLLFNLFHLSF